MFCPQCGQQQVSDAVRFCSRCGFRLEGVANLLMTGGVPGGVAAGADDKVVASPKRTGVKKGGKIILVGVFLIPLFALLHELIGLPNEAPLIGVLIVIIGIFRLLYSLLFDEGTVRRTSSLAQPSGSETGEALQAQRAQGALPGVRETPVQSYQPPRVATSELQHRPSVTEGTTRLLEEQDSSEGRSAGGREG